MASIQSVGNTPADALAAMKARSGEVSKENSAADQQGKFLTLLVAQMKNQDPLNPVDNAQVTSQLAQISTVDGIERLNSTMKAVMGSVEGSQTVQAATLAGRQVLVEGNALELANGKGVAGFELPQAIDSLEITISSAAGAVIHKVDMGAQPAGIHAFEWDGATDAGSAAVPGAYSFKLRAVAQGQEITTVPLSMGRVDGVSRGSDGLNVSVGKLGPRTLEQIRRIM